MRTFEDNILLLYKSLVLIDEFENGLGVNCIDVLAELLLGERRDLQFVITSHHPKIINQISNSSINTKEFFDIVINSTI